MNENTIFSKTSVEHYPVTVKLENVKDFQISGITCSEEGVVFLSDIGRNQIYRMDNTNGTCFSFGQQMLSEFVFKISLNLLNMKI